MPAVHLNVVLVLVLVLVVAAAAATSSLSSRLTGAPCHRGCSSTKLACEQHVDAGGGGESRVISDAVDVISGTGGLEVRAKRATTSVVGDQRAAPLNVTVNWTRNSDDGSLSALIYFRLLSPGARDNRSTTVKLYWRTNTCNALPGFKYCDLPNSHNSKTYYAYYNQWTNDTVSNLLYNSDYFFDVEYEADRAKQSAHVTLRTPGCPMLIEDSFKRCARLGPPLTEEKKAANPELLIRVTCVSAVDQQRSKLSVWITWPLPTTRVDVEQWHSFIEVANDRRSHLDYIAETDTDHKRLDLPANQIFNIRIAARHESATVVYETLRLNLSTAGDTDNDTIAGLPICRSSSTASSRPAAAAWTSRNGDDAAHDHQTALLVGLLSFLSLCVAAVAAAFHKRCQQRLSRLLFATTKTPSTAAGVNKTNSYKSSPSGSVRLLNDGTSQHRQQLSDVSVDDWEVDPRHVALGVEIGQGAFGRVLTGFYRNEQVAIKVLKEHIPDTYRDDLLREIALMKSVGQHSNIVSMVGACTARRPIALIMEYVPYGNLQNFLKRCRRERESETRAADRDNMTYCLIDELTGRNEHWTINASDVLSFARQVAVAMEYLSGRNFVHRDLAARNVLLGYNKMVKVCDFGLARVVYTGDQYCKLTSGRLPLKWMAIESIRDRVFTTHSDVWSFGVLLWEIVTMGASPYPNIALADVYRLLCEGYRMLQPKNCSDELYDIMSQCWCESPAYRPTFERLRHELEDLLSRDVTYLELDDIDAPLAAQTQSTADDDDDDADELHGTSTSSTLLGLHLDVC